MPAVGDVVPAARTVERENGDAGSTHLGVVQSRGAEASSSSFDEAAKMAGSHILNTDTVNLQVESVVSHSTLAQPSEQRLVEEARNDQVPSNQILSEARVTGDRPGSAPVAAEDVLSETPAAVHATVVAAERPPSAERATEAPSSSAPPQPLHPANEQARPSIDGSTLTFGPVVVPSPLHTTRTNDGDAAISNQAPVSVDGRRSVVISERQEQDLSSHSTGVQPQPSSARNRYAPADVINQDAPADVINQGTQARDFASVQNHGGQFQSPDFDLENQSFPSRPPSVMERVSQGFTAARDALPSQGALNKFADEHRGALTVGGVATGVLSAALTGGAATGALGSFIHTLKSG